MEQKKDIRLKTKELQKKYGVLLILCQLLIVISVRFSYMEYQELPVPYLLRFAVSKFILKVKKIIFLWVVVFQLNSMPFAY